MLDSVPDNLDWPSSWDRALASLQANPGVCLVMGGVDTGKSTFCRTIAWRCHEDGIRTAIVDADLGQSYLAPPTTVASRILPDAGPAAWWFVGDTSAQRCPVAAVVGAVRIANEAAAAGAQCLIVDTCGWVRGYEAAALKEAKIALLRPRHLVALQRENELEPILAAYRGRSDLTVHRLRPSPRVRRRSQDQRRAHRQRMFAHHFANAVELEVDLGGLAVAGAPILRGRTPPPHVRAMAEDALGMELLHAEEVADGLTLVCERRPSPPDCDMLAQAFPEERIEIVTADDFRGRIAALSDAEGRFTSLVIVTDVDFATGRLCLLAPKAVEADPVRLTFGALRLAPDFSDLGAASTRRLVIRHVQGANTR